MKEHKLVNNSKLVLEITSDLAWVGMSHAEIILVIKNALAEANFARIELSKIHEKLGEHEQVEEHRKIIEKNFVVFHGIKLPESDEIEPVINGLVSKDMPESQAILEWTN